VPYAAGLVASGRGSWLPHLRGNHPDWRRSWVRRTPAHAPLDEELPQPELEPGLDPPDKRSLMVG